MTRTVHQCFHSVQILTLAPCCPEVECRKVQYNFRLAMSLFSHNTIVCFAKVCILIYYACIEVTMRVLSCMQHKCWYVYNRLSSNLVSEMCPDIAGWVPDANSNKKSWIQFIQLDCICFLTSVGDITKANTSVSIFPQ